MTRIIVAIIVALLSAVAVVAAPAVTSGGAMNNVLRLDTSGALYVKCATDQPPDAGLSIRAVDVDSGQPMVCYPNPSYFDGGVWR